MAVMFALDLSDGQHVETSGNGVIGRNPASHTPGTEFDDPAHVELVTVSDDAKSVSRESYEQLLTSPWTAADDGEPPGWQHR